MNTAKAFSASTFGALQFRLVDKGVVGDWQALANLVRLPIIRDFRCPKGAGQSCELDGANLFLITALAGDPGFDHAIEVPEGFTGDVLPAPEAATGRLYLKLRDEPTVVDRVSVPAKIAAPTPSPAPAIPSKP